MLMNKILIRCIGPQTNKKGTKIGDENIRKKGFGGRERKWENVVSGIQSEYSIDVNICNGGLK